MSRIIVNDKYNLINVIFSGELAEVAMGSEELLLMQSLMSVWLDTSHHFGRW
jgi:hypothetical protein